ncbi:hypothetical protein TNCV_1811051 [Trichonephila clavipes]|nr:hypothetical protein TNCV_1811051 [Trichonephila clavipes]
MVLKANDRRTSCPCHDEFRGPRSDYVRQVASENNKQQQDEFFNIRSSPDDETTSQVVSKFQKWFSTELKPIKLKLPQFSF